jgi:hypothetical protein
MITAHHLNNSRSQRVLWLRFGSQPFARCVQARFGGGGAYDFQEVLRIEA